MKIEELRKIAEAATDKTPYMEGGRMYEASHDFLSTFSPSTVLALLDRLKVAEEALLELAELTPDKWVQHHIKVDNTRPSMEWQTTLNTKARVALVELRKEIP